MWCVDVGANYGYYSVLMALACGREGRVLACEPNPLLAETYLPGNLTLNGCRDQVEICQKVIGRRDQERVDFVLHHGDYATSSLERWAYPHRAEAIQVPMATLDRLCGEWDSLDVVKIDAEGAEALVWEGMQETIRRFPRTAVVMELHLQRDPPQTVGLLHEIERAGYPLRAINYEGEVVPVDVDTILAQPGAGALDAVAAKVMIPMVVPRDPETTHQIPASRCPTNTTRSSTSKTSTSRAGLKTCERSFPSTTCQDKGSSGRGR